MAKYTKSKLTKKYARLAVIFTILSILLMFGPLAYYTIMGFMGGALVVQKVALIGSVLTALIATFLCVAMKWTFKSKMWLFVIGLFFVIENFLPMIIIFAVTQVLDELVVSPLARHYRASARSCKNTDKQFAERNL